jgi:hypothetical protein
MAVPRRAERLRRIAYQLNEQYGLPRDTEVRTEIDEYARPKVWRFLWWDGPTEGQVKRAAAKLDKDALEGVAFRREYTAASYALAAIRLAQAGDPEHDLYGSQATAYDAQKLLGTIKNPEPRDERERSMAARLVVAADGKPSVYGDGDAICNLVRDKGLAWLLRGDGDVTLSPIERLTERYAPSRASLAWSRRLESMTALEAFSAVQADPTAKPDAVVDALTLLPTLHAELDQAAAELRARVTGEEQAS